MTKLILSTGNIVSGGPSIIRKPGDYRSNLELTNSLRSNFLAAQQDYAEEADGSEPGGALNGDGRLHSSTETGRLPLSAWTERDGDTLYVPRIDWTLSGLQESTPPADADDNDEGSKTDAPAVAAPPSATAADPGRFYDITAKLFFLPSPSAAGSTASTRLAYAREALGLVRRELGGAIRGVDLLVASFPGMSFEADCEFEADRRNALQGDADAELAGWRALEQLHGEGAARRLGIAEFGSEKLKRFLGQVQVRPSVDQINIRNCCKVPPPLAELAKREEIELLVHSDCTDVLPKGTLRELLGSGVRGAGVLIDGEDGEDMGGDGLRGDLTPLWVVKYTALVKDRGVIENKGYFAAAELTEAPLSR